MGHPIGCLILMLGLMAAGCNRPANGVDPFLGRTTIPPPATGSVGDPYYPGAAPVYPGPAATVPPTVEFPPAGTNPAPPPTYQPLPSTGTPSLQPPPASYYQGSSVETPAASSGLTDISHEPPPRLRPVPQFDTGPAVAAAPSTRPATASNNVVVIDNDATGNPVVRVSHGEIQGNPLPLASNVRLPRASDGPQPTYAAPSTTVTGPVMRRVEGTIDLADLPPVRAASPSVARTSSASRGASSIGFREAAPAAGRSVLVDSSQNNMATATARAEASGQIGLAHHQVPQPAARRGDYGHASDYSWLKGELEYSASRNEWKLRYMPIDAPEMDQYGGSVVLAASQLLANHQPGDFVKVEGRIAGAAGGDSGQFAPRYEPTRIQ